MARSKPPTLETGPIADYVVDGIRTTINDRTLTVGDSMPTGREFCEAFGASRNTVREAMRVLKA
ncbi:FadR/GntR family transcriptional regulator [Vannielia litorea]|uniref:FadR/GntR family transcriptional regulator n=1 Tax=Vannielia litorea TaxID=1217970 RepID=UPI001BCEF26A